MHITGDEYLIGHWIPALPPLIVNRVSKEYALPGLGLKGSALVSLHMGIGPAPKDTKVGHRGFLTIEGFKGSLPSDSRGGGAIESVQETGESFTPEFGRQMRVREERSNTFIQNTISALSNTILLRSSTSVCCLSIPCSSMNASHSLDMYSPPLSSLRALRAFPVCFSAQDLNCLKAENASLFLWRSQTRR